MDYAAGINVIEEEAVEQIKCVWTVLGLCHVSNHKTQAQVYTLLVIPQAQAECY